MVRQTRSKKAECVGKGKVTPVQIAFIVDRYLSDNNFTQTRSTFRSEASHLISKSPVQEAPKSLLSLGAILDEYITLKEQKVWMDQERCRLEQEKSRVQIFSNGMQEVINAYSLSANQVVKSNLQLPAPPPSAVASGVQAAATASGYYPMYNNPAILPASMPSNNLSTSVTVQSATKRKGSKYVSDGPMVSKKSRRCPQPKVIDLVGQTSNAENNHENSLLNPAAESPALSSGAPNGSPAQGSNVAKHLLIQKLPSPPTISSVHKTPPRASSVLSSGAPNGSPAQGSNVAKRLFTQKLPSPPTNSSIQTEKSISPVEISSIATSTEDIPRQQFMSTNCTIFSSETIRVSPTKGYYSIERNRCISTSSPVKRSNVNDHVKGRLDFGTSEVAMITDNLSPDSTSTSESDKDADNILDMDFPNLDNLDWDVSLSEFLRDFDMPSDGLGLSSTQVFDSSPESYSGSPQVDMGARQVTTQFSSAMAGILGDKDMNLASQDSLSTVRSFTKRVILSPVKGHRSSFDQENSPSLK